METDATDRSIELLCLQISVNGHVVLTAGHDRAESLTAHVEVLPQNRAVALSADALAALDTSSSEFLKWPTPANEPWPIR